MRSFKLCFTENEEFSRLDGNEASDDEQLDTAERLKWRSQIAALAYDRTDRQTDRRTDRQTDGQTDRRTDRQTGSQ
jgi:hypothetical protein